jgi:alpha-tubulin suppressor-like RCC1 family protein
LRAENGPAPTAETGIASGSHVAVTGGDRESPTLVTALQHIKIKQIACGFSHSIALSDKGLMFVWGGGMTGKLGLGHITEEFECFCPCPTALHLPSKSIKCTVSILNFSLKE